MTKHISATSSESAPQEEARIRKLATSVQRRAPLDALTILENETDETVAAVLGRLPQSFATQVLLRFPAGRQKNIVPEVRAGLGEQWSLNQRYAKDSVGRLMSLPVAVFHLDTTVRQAIEAIRELSRSTLVTYAYVVDAEQRLQGVVVMRDLMLANPDEKLGDVMVDDPFCFTPDTNVSDAMRAVVHRHYPVYPVCDDNQRLIGLVQGYLLFEQHAFEISAQSGRMVGVDREEHFTTPWMRCLKLRQPWLQLNLLTAFLAAATVGAFEESISKVIALAVFLPVLAGQAGNTGCQALAVTVRGLTLGEYSHEAMRTLVSKESLLGLLNGAMVGVVAAAAMVLYAGMTHTPDAWMLGLVVLMAMIGSCVTSGVAGVVVPLLLVRFDIDPASASGIFVTTATDVASMGMFLGCATALVL